LTASRTQRKTRKEREREADVHRPSEHDSRATTARFRVTQRSEMIDS